jgi:signal transduction histidine kinase
VAAVDSILAATIPRFQCFNSQMGRNFNPIHPSILHPDSVLEYSNQQELVAQTTIPEAIKITTMLMEQIRNLSLQLRPPMLDTLGLIPTLRWHFEHYTAQTHIQVNFQAQLPQHSYPPETELTAYRVVQEALTNIARHARVSEAFVALHGEADALDIFIEDHGVGFDPDVIQAIPHTGSLLGIQERINALGGNLIIDSKPEKGMRIHAKLFLRTN